MKAVVNSEETERLNCNNQSFQGRKCPCFHPSFLYRQVKISDRGAIFMIIFNMSFAAPLIDFNSFKKRNDSSSLEYTPAFSWILALGIVFLLGPVLGFLSDTFFGRYKILKASLYLRLVAIILIALDVIIPSAILLYMIVVALALSVACYVYCIIPFTIDQLVGASGEELSFTIYWMIWAWTTYHNVIDLLTCYAPQSFQLQHALWFFVSSISFIIAYLMMQCCSHVLMTKPQLSNPIKLMAQVLNYARKNKFPKRRSAFTYWEEQCPSRIDLGKDKYGGPFTIEEVEDVKTFLRLIPLISCISLFFGLEGSVLVAISVFTCEISDLLYWIRFLQNLVIIAYLPIYQFIIYPFLYNHIPSMLRRIGFGFCLMVLSHLFNSAVELSVLEQSHMSHVNTTVTNVTHQTGNVPISAWLMVSSNLMNKLGLFLAAVNAIEFCMAQAPCQVRGLVSSIFLALAGTFAALGSALLDTLHHNPVAYMLLSKALLSCFVIFMFVSMWYKLRKRDDIIPYHMFAEDQFESDYRQKREWRRKLGYSE